MAPPAAFQCQHTEPGCLSGDAPQVTEHPKCRIKLTVLDESSGKGKAAGHKVKLTAALVLAGTSTEGLSKPGR